MRDVSSFLPARLENHILVAAHHAREEYFPKQTRDVPEWDMVLGVYRFLSDSKPMPSQELRSILIDHRTVATPEFKFHLKLGIEQGAEREKAFTGNKEFSMDKLAAMVSHITSRGLTISRAKLETILYYSDLVSYVIFSASISGSKYIRHRFRPGMNDFDSRIEHLISSGVVSIHNHEALNESIVAGDKVLIGELSMLEIVTIHWVLNQMGEMSEREVIKYAEGEHAHRFTRIDAFIAYEYGRLLKNLPESLN